MSKLKVLLHAGCGTEPLPTRFSGFTEIRLDIDFAAKPDIVASITKIPMGDAAVEVVFSSHNLEHLAEHKVPWPSRSSIAC